MNPEDVQAVEGTGEKARLKALLADDYYDLSNEGDVCCGFRTLSVEGTGGRRWSEAMYVVTRSDITGENFRWEYARGLTESQENEYNDYTEIVPVKPVTKIVSVTEWQVIK